MIPEKGRDYVLDAALYSIYWAEGPQKGLSRRTFSEGNLIYVIRHEFLKEYLDNDEVRQIAKILCEKKLLVLHADEFAENYYEISAKFENVYKNKLADNSSPLNKIDSFGEAWLVSALEKIFADRIGPKEKKPGDDAPEKKAQHPTLDDVPDFDNLSDVDRLSEVERLSDIGAPASDRVVKRSDNEETWSSAVAGAKELHDALVATNDHGDLDDDEFEQKLSEVRALQIMLDSPQVHWEVLKHLAEKTVKYLASKFADNAIGLAAAGLLTYLTSLLAGG